MNFLSTALFILGTIGFMQIGGYCIAKCNNTNIKFCIQLISIGLIVCTPMIVMGLMLYIINNQDAILSILTKRF